MTALLFLDLDGVLHTDHSPRFARLPVLVQALHEIECGIVISSSWRHQAELVELAGYLGVLGSRVIGATPAVPFRPESGPPARFLRQTEIETWRQVRRAQGPFLVLDDDELGFEVDWPHLLLVDPLQGLTDEDGARIQAWFRGLSAR